MKNYTKSLQQTTESYWSQSCNSAGCSLTGSANSVLTEAANGLSSVSSINNKRKRPWSAFSYVKWKSGGGLQRSVVMGNYLTYSPMKENWYVRTRTATHTFWHTGSGSVSSSMQSEANTIAQAKLYSSIKEAREQWNAAVSLGEGRETARHIARTASRLYHGFVAFKKGDLFNAYKHLVGRSSKHDGWQVMVERPRRFMEVPVWDPKRKPSDEPKYYSGWKPPTRRNLRRRDVVLIDRRHEAGIRKTKSAMADKNFLDDVSSAWMELSFAWRPLLKDIDSAARHIAERRMAKDDGVHRFSRRHNVEVTTQTAGSLNTTNPVYASFDKKVARCRWSVELRFKPHREVTTMEELGFTDPATVAWNLLPLSFVVDWFLNVGQVLESLHTYKNLTPLRAIYGTKNATLTDRYLLKNYTNSNGRPPDYVSANRQYLKYESYSRVPTSLPAAVPLKVNVSNPFDLKNGQMATLGVLLRYAFNGTRPSIR